MTVGPALTSLICLLIFDPEAVPLCQGRLPADQMGLTGSMGVMADPAAVTSFTIPHDMQVVKVPFPVSETCITFSKTGLNQGAGMALEAQRIGFRIIGNVLAAIEALLRKRRASLMRCVTVRTIALSHRLMPETAVVKDSFNLAVTHDTVTGWAGLFRRKRKGCFRAMSVVALQTPSIGRTAVCGTPVGDPQMACPAIEGRHFRRILVGIMAIMALILVKGRVKIGAAGLIAMAIGTGSAAHIPEQFIAGGGVRVVASAAICSKQDVPMLAIFLVIVAFEAQGRDPGNQ